MTEDEIIKLAIESGLVVDDGDSLVTGWVEWADLTPFVLKFAELLETEITRREVVISPKYIGPFDIKRMRDSLAGDIRTSPSGLNR